MRGAKVPSTEHVCDPPCLNAINRGCLNGNPCYSYHSCLYRLLELCHINNAESGLLDALCYPVFLFLIERKDRLSHKAALEDAALYSVSFRRACASPDGWPPP